MATMTSRERCMRIFQGKEVDRPALKLWGLKEGQKLCSERYRPVYERGLQLTDLFDSVGSPFDLLFGADHSGVEQAQWDEPRPDGEWVDRHLSLVLHGRRMHAVHRWSRRGAPGYDMEHFVKTPEDLKAFLAHPYIPLPPDLRAHREAVARMGERGVVMYGLSHAAYAVQRLMGSEIFAIFCMDERPLLQEIITELGRRILEHVQAVLAQGLRPVFGYVGPELCIPPLVSWREFEEFVFDVDKPICDAIHNGGGYVWMHCHGKVGKLLTRYADMGIDVLNPIEPPPMGDVTLAQAVALVGSRMGLEGNIENPALILEPPESLRAMVIRAVREGSAAGRFILCPSSGYAEYVDPSPAYIENLLIYLNEGYTQLCALAK